MSDLRTAGADSTLISSKSAIGTRHTEEALPSDFAREDLLAARLRVTKVLPYQQSAPPFLSNLSLAIISGLLMILAFPDWNIWSLGWLAAAPLIMAVAREGRFWRSLFLGYVTGTLFYMGSSHWVTHTMHNYGEIPLLLSYLILALFASLLGLFTGLFGGALALMIKRFGGGAILAAPAVWAASEWARIEIIGVGWNALGYSQAFKPAVIQISRWGGVYIVSALLVSASAALVFALAYISRRRGIIVLTSAGVLAIATVLYGQAIKGDDDSGSVSVAAVQPNIPISGPWGDSAFVDQMTLRHTMLSQQAIQSKSKDRPAGNGGGNFPGPQAASDGSAPQNSDAKSENSDVDIVIWPESPMSFEYDRDMGLRLRLAEFTRRNKVHLLMSSWGFPQGTTESRDQYNSALVIAPSGEKIAQYDKIALVPFGEYVPARGWLPFMDRVPALVYDIAPGTNLTLFDVAGARIGTLICFEATRPDIARRMRRMGASTLAQISNELWYNSAAAARQMLAQAVFRAVENNTALIRVTNSGLSARIDSKGNTHDETPMFETATRVWKMKTSDEASADPLTFYTRYGDVFAGACAALSLLFLVATFLPRKEYDEEGNLRE